MQIFVNGEASRDYAPDQISASVTFQTRQATYDEALSKGVALVKHYIEEIAKVTDFTTDDFKTSSYRIAEQFRENKLEPKTEADLGKNLVKRVSDGFVFTQQGTLTFDYDRERLARLLTAPAQIPNAPRLQIRCELKDVAAKQRELIGEAYADAQRKAEALAAAAGKNLRDCVRVEIDTPASGRDAMIAGTPLRKATLRGSGEEAVLSVIDETFKPDDITVSKQIACIWETSN